MKTEKRKPSELVIGKRYFFDAVKDISGVLCKITKHEIRFNELQGDLTQYTKHTDGSVGFANIETQHFHEIVSK